MIYIQVADLNRIHQWVAMRHLLWGGDESQLASEAQTILDDDDQLCFLALNTEEKEIGFIEASLRVAKSSSYAFIEGWFVQPSFRRKGVGKQLMDAVEQWALHHSIESILSDTCPESYPDSMSAHEHAGFEVLGTTVILMKQPNKGAQPDAFGAG